MDIAKAKGLMKVELVSQSFIKYLTIIDSVLSLNTMTFARLRIFAGKMCRINDCQVFDEGLADQLHSFIKPLAWRYP